jgi:hypothetical protein
MRGFHAKIEANCGRAHTSQVPPSPAVLPQLPVGVVQARAAEEGVPRRLCTQGVMEAKKQQKKAGRPSKLTAKQRSKLFKLAEEGLSVEQLALACDVAVKTVYNWQKDPEVQKHLQESKRVADHRVVVSLFRRACGYSHPDEKVFIHNGKPVIVHTVKYYPPDTEAAKFWLTNRLPEEWSNKQKTELSGNVVWEIVDYANADETQLQAAAA